MRRQKGKWGTDRQEKDEEKEETGRVYRGSGIRESRCNEREEAMKLEREGKRERREYIHKWGDRMGD